MCEQSDDHVGGSFARYCTVTVRDREYVRFVIINYDGALLVTASEDGTLCQFSGEVVHKRTLQLPLYVYALAYHDPTCLLAAACGDKKVHLSCNLTAVGVLEGHRGWIYHVAFDGTGTRLVSGGYEGEAIVWALQQQPTGRVDGVLLYRLSGHTGDVTSVTMSADGTRAVSASEDETLRVWHLRADGGDCIHVLQGHTCWVRGCALSPDGALVLSASHDTTLKLWDAHSGALLRTLQGHTDFVYGCCFSPDGMQLLSCSADMTARVWRTADGAPLHTL